MKKYVDRLNTALGGGSNEQPNKKISYKLIEN
jgi:hypothetical protein